MGRLRVTPAHNEEIVAELASHLEDLYEEQRAEGCGQSEAIEQVLGEVTEWRQLARNIRRAKCEEDEMNNRTKRFWLPALVSLTTANAFLMILQRTALSPHLFKVSSAVVALYVPLLVASPLIGATGAYLSHRAGGSRVASLAAGLFPLTAMLALICFLAVTGGFATPQLFYFAIAIIFGVVLPGAALLLGVLPFLKASKSIIPSTN